MGTNALMNVKLQGKLLNLHLKHTHRTSENQFHNFFWQVEELENGKGQFAGEFLYRKVSICCRCPAS